MSAETNTPQPRTTTPETQANIPNGTIDPTASFTVEPLFDAPGFTAGSPREAGFTSFEVIDGTVDTARLAFNGLRHFIVRHRTERAHNAIPELSRAIYIHHEAADSELDDHSTPLRLTPETRYQRGRAVKASKRLRKNMSKAVENFDRSEIYGRDIDDDSYRQRIDNAGYTRKQHRQAVHAGRKHKSSIEGHVFGKVGGIKRRTGRVERSALGEDIPGRVLRRRLNRKQNYVAQADATIRQLTDQIWELQDARDERSARRKVARKETADAMVRRGKQYVETVGSTKSAYIDARSGVTVSNSRAQKTIDRLARSSGRLYARVKR